MDPQSHEVILDVTEFQVQALRPEKRSEARNLIGDVLQGYDLAAAASAANPLYNRAELIRLVGRHAVPPSGSDQFLSFLIAWLDAPAEPNPQPQPPPPIGPGLARLGSYRSWEASRRESMFERVTKFADYLLFAFLLPFKTEANKIPVPTPFSLASSIETPVGTLSRLNKLRKHCMRRDRHRCVATRVFDSGEASKRFAEKGVGAMDDDGNLLISYPDKSEPLEVAHIIPLSLMSRSPDSSGLSQSKVQTLAILNMFDPGVVQDIEGSDIDRTHNAITLTHSMHKSFGNLDLYFERDEDGPAMDSQASPTHTYTIKTFDRWKQYEWGFPIRRTLFESHTFTIDMPSPRLLHIHRACSIILHASGAGEYIERLLREQDGIPVRADGSTPLAELVSLRMWQVGA